MVKGISRQVIVVHAPDPRLFDQAIFILKDGAAERSGITDDALLKEANRLIRSGGELPGVRKRLYGPVWALAGAVFTGILWLISVLL